MNEFQLSPVPATPQQVPHTVDTNSETALLTPCFLQQLIDYALPVPIDDALPVPVPVLCKAVPMRFSGCGRVGAVRVTDYNKRRIEGRQPFTATHRIKQCTHRNIITGERIYCGAKNQHPCKYSDLSDQEKEEFDQILSDENWELHEDFD